MDEIKLLEERLLDPQFRKSRKDLEIILDDDFIEYGSSGGVFNKKQIIDLLISEDMPNYTIMNFTARNLSHDIILANYQALNQDADRVQKSNRCSIWKRVSGHWKMLFHQGTNCS